MFADEPTGNLDSRSGAEILSFLKQSVDDLGQTIVMVTHDPTAAGYADAAVFLRVRAGPRRHRIIVAQRLRELALLRALGASRRQVTRSVLTEGVLVGFFASLIGVGFGVFVAIGLKAIFAAVGADLPSSTLVIKPRTVIVPVVVGVLITTLSSWGPARKASKVPPVAAIRGADSIPEGRPAECHAQPPAHVVDRRRPHDRSRPGQLRHDPAASLKASFAATLDRSVKADYIIQGPNSGYIITLDDFGANAGDDLDSLVLAKRAKGVSDQAARAAVAPILADYPSVELQDQAAYKKQVAGQIDKLLLFVVILLLLAVLIALIGIVNTLALSIFERTRELGLLRAVGMARRQLKRMIRWESIIITILGAVLGLGVGAFFGWAAVSAMGDIGVDRLSLPAFRLVMFVVVAGGAGVVAAIFPARRAARLDVLDAIAHQ